MNPQKKVLILIVEGDTDLAVFSSYIKEIVDPERVKIHVTRGDVFTKEENFGKEATEIIKEVTEEVKQEYFLTDEDIFYIIQLCDIDGIYIPLHDYHIQPKGYFGDKTYYFDSHRKRIIVKNKYSKNKLFETWKNKKDQQDILINTNEINGIKYRLYFYSLNLEHFLSNEIIEDIDDKWECVDNFVEKYPNLEDFKQFVNDDSNKVSDNYEESWHLISNETDFFSNGVSNVNIFIKDFSE
ncbi:hypothetical protein ACIQXI_01775 [Lysinibacillus sp. NPDC097195]|uniref:hypothetical protein n=1 Tax=Lysinibacillus sp. NPDC097195 TaxID=3364141 RepID=UPI0038146381